MRSAARILRHINGAPPARTQKQNSASSGVGSLLPLKRVPPWQTSQWQKAPDTFQRSLTRPPLSRQKRQNARRDSSQVQSRQQIAETEFCRPKSMSPELSSRHKATTAHPGKEAPAVIPFALSPRGTPRGPARFLGVPRNDITAIVSDGITTARSLALPSLPKSC